MKAFALENPKRPTARRSIATILTEEILKHPGPADFPISSEHQLCRRFSVSRVTIRLALGDLEHRGLIYRRHGKGTFAHGCSTRVYQNLGILLDEPADLKCSSLIDFVRGAQTVATSLRSALVLISTAPTDWHQEMAKALCGVIVMRGCQSEDVLGFFRKHNLPFGYVPDLGSIDGEIRAFEMGECTAKSVFYRSKTGETESPFDGPEAVL